MDAILQIHKVLKGLTPVRSLFAVSSGAAKLVSLPVKTYKKDHRLLKGIQRGKYCTFLETCFRHEIFFTGKISHYFRHPLGCEQLLIIMPC